MLKSRWLIPVALAVAVFCLGLASAVVTAGDKEALPGPDDFVPVEVYPEMIHQEPPPYPAKAKQAGIEGAVWIKSLVNKKGEVVESMLGKSSGHDMLDKAALAAAEKCKYKPALQNSQPVAVWVTFKTDFVLDDCEGDKKAQKAEKAKKDQEAKKAKATHITKDEFVEVASMPEVIHTESPVYPEKLAQAGISGVVMVKSMVASDGSVKNAEVAKSSGHDMFDKAALKAAYKCKYKPAIDKNGKAVATWIQYKVDFNLSDKK